MAESESKKSESPFSRRISKEERFGSKTSVCSSGGCGVRFSFILLNIFSFLFQNSNLLSVTSLETYLNTNYDDSGDETCNTLTINVPIMNVRKDIKDEHITKHVCW